MKKYIIGLVVLVVLGAAGMYGYSRYSQNQAKESVKEYLDQAGKEQEQTKQTPTESLEQKTPSPSPSPSITDAKFTGEVKLTPQNTKLAWIGRKTLVVGYEDAGKIDLVSGIAKVENGKVTQVTATIDITSIGVIKSGKGKDEDKLTAHLKSPAFFDAEKYPTAELKITQAKLVAENSGQQDYEFSGTLNMKGVIADVSFPSKVSWQSNSVKLEMTTKLDRTKWGVNYGSSKLADSFIDDFFSLNVTVNAEVK